MGILKSWPSSVVLIFAAALSWSPGRALGADQRSDVLPYKVNLDQAEALANIALEMVDDGAWLEGGLDDDGRFYGYWAYAVHGNGHYAEVAVNPWTGDVWDVWKCKKIKKLELQAAQKTLKEINFSEREDLLYANLSMRRPICLKDW
ncbi:PepSY domain-containing protein [Nitrospirillum amazonense]|uniref:PepSY domain-containing protein n=1 Tax=Nitrospirillum amazonense TaxID=28077 RepID=UPI0024124028|nr:PepSY domain-containing protein [Nitrospirillum amazonense]MDG3443243.1 PepSY domain-containing protein [Nitrospirillum amazonense]